MLYIAKYWKRDAYGNDIGEERICATKRSAELWAKSVLGTITVTNDTYWRDIGRADSVSVYERATPVAWARYGKKVAEHGPEVRIVPSVGELGWTP